MKNLKRVKIVDKSRGIVFFRVGNRFFRLEDNSYFRHYSVKTGWTLMELVTTDSYEEEKLTDRDIIERNFDAEMMEIYCTKMDGLLALEDDKLDMSQYI